MTLGGWTDVVCRRVQFAVSVLGYPPWTISHKGDSDHRGVPILAFQWLPLSHWPGWDQMTILRLLLFSACNRSCPGCCNKQWDLDSLPKVETYTGFDMVILTGGEPMLNPSMVVRVASEIQSQTSAPIILYTARPQELPSVMPFVDGVTLTLHEQSDVEPFLAFHCGLETDKSMRLNVFEGVDVPDVPGWRIKSGIKWIEDCPLPSDEIFMRY